MTPEQFYDTEMFEVAQQFFNRATGERTRTTSSTRISKVPARHLRGSIAAAALGLIALNMPMVSASTLELVRTELHAAEAAVKVPRLTGAQARAARVIRSAFDAVPIGEDAEGEDPDYGF